MPKGLGRKARKLGRKLTPAEMQQRRNAAAASAAKRRGKGKKKPGAKRDTGRFSVDREEGKKRFLKLQDRYEAGELRDTELADAEDKLKRQLGIGSIEEWDDFTEKAFKPRDLKQRKDAADASARKRRGKGKSKSSGLKVSASEEAHWQRVAADQDRFQQRDEMKRGGKEGDAGTRLIRTNDGRTMSTKTYRAQLRALDRAGFGDKKRSR